MPLNSIELENSSSKIELQSNKSVLTDACFNRNSIVSANCNVSVVELVDTLDNISNDYDNTYQQNLTLNLTLNSPETQKSKLLLKKDEMLSVYKSSSLTKASLKNHNQPSMNYIEIEDRRDDVQNYDSTTLVIPILEKQYVSRSFIATKSPSLNDSTTQLLSESNLPLRKNVTLLEQIVKTHPIWYLPHLGRAAANHLLRSMPPGVIIILKNVQKVSFKKKYKKICKQFECVTF